MENLDKVTLEQVIEEIRLAIEAADREQKDAAAKNLFAIAISCGGKRYALLELENRLRGKLLTCYG